jgi:hypothetical protein
MGDHQRRSTHDTFVHRDRAHQRCAVLLPSSRQERCGHWSIEQRRQPGPTHGAVRTSAAGIPRDRAGVDDVDSTNVQRRGSDHPLRHPTFHEPNQRMGLHQHHDSGDGEIVHRQGLVKRHPLLLPYRRGQRCRRRNVESGDRRRSLGTRRRLLLPQLHRCRSGRSGATASDTAWLSNWARS